MKFIDQHAARCTAGRRWGVASICAQLGQLGAAISPSTYYADRPAEHTSVRSRAGRRASAAALVVLGIVLHALNNSSSLDAVVPAGRILYTVCGLGVVSILAAWLLLRRLEPAHGRLLADTLTAHGEPVDDDTRARLESRTVACRARRAGHDTRDRQDALVTRARTLLEA